MITKHNPNLLTAVPDLAMMIGRQLGTGLCFLILALQAGAQDTEPVTYSKNIKDQSVYQRIWESSHLYENDTNQVIQVLSLIGRYHGQYYSVNADQGSANDWENRRLFIGMEAVLFHDFTVHLQIKISDDFNPFYNGLYQAFVKWSPNDEFTLVAGRQDFLFAGMERSLSSTKIVTFERSLLTNQLFPGEVVGAGVKFKSGDFTYRAGVFSGSIEQEFTSFAGGFGFVAGVGYTLPLFYSDGSLHLEYIYNNGNPSNNALEPYDHVLSLWHQGYIGPFGLGVEMNAGHGIEGRKPVWGATALGTYELSKDLLLKGDALQAVLRYQYAASDGDNGLYLQSRYEQKVVLEGSGNAYHAIYAGINYLIYSNRLKLMTGVEYSMMEDTTLAQSSFKGWTYFAGVRVYM